MWAIHKQNDEGLDVVELDKANESRLITVCETERAALGEGIRIAGANIQSYKNWIRLESNSIRAFQSRLKILRQRATR